MYNTFMDRCVPTVFLHRGLNTLLVSLIILTFLILHRRLPVRRRVLETFPPFSVSGPCPLMFQAFKSLLTVSFHINFGLPLGRFPSIFISATARMFSVSSVLLTCPNYSNIRLIMTIAIGTTLCSQRLYRLLLYWCV